MAQREDLRLGLVVHQGQHIDRKARLQGRLGKEAVQDHLGVGVLFQLDDDAHAVAVGLVAQVGDALEALVVHLVGNILDELFFIDLIGELRDDDAHTVLPVLLKFGAGADHDAAAARGVGRPDAAAAHDDAAGREVRPLDVLHQIGELAVGVFEHADAGVDDLA